MSWSAAEDPACLEAEHCPEPVETVIEPRARDLGEFEVRRVLPSRSRRMVGPFLFFDEMGPVDFQPGQGIDVRPHPHIHLATVTYLFEGEILHRDSLGCQQAIRPGAINWMTAGRGIVHSERTDPARRAAGARLHGLQLWLALPVDQQDTDPAFRHYPAEDLPEVQQPGATLRVMIGEAYGARSPVETLSPTFYVDVSLEAGAEIAAPTGHRERAVYVVSGALEVGGTEYRPGRMLVLREGVDVALRASADSRFVILGGEPFPEPRHMWWNFVSSDKSRIEQAKADWKAGRFPKVLGDEDEFIPLPEG